MNPRFLRFITHAAVAGAILHPSASQADDIIVYKETCNWAGFANWNLVCPVKNNTAADVSNEASVWFANTFKNLKSITVCASFTNRGGLNVPAIIVHNHGDASQSKPTDLFDTIRFRGNITPDQMSWTGIGPRNVPPTAANWSLRADLSRTSDRGPFVYTETLLNGQRILGEIRATCRALEDSEGSAK
jgi:hypothetical protein